jgi:anthranilate phosphoribosyltransferase
MQNLTEHLATGADLSPSDASEAALGLLDESVADSAKADFLRALAAKGETPAEIAAFVETFLEHAVDPGFGPDDCSGPTIDVCGTGGDKLDLFNISTASVFVLAGGGACVVKHGNRGITSKSGGADVLESLGVPIGLPVERLRDCVLQHGVGFLFAPLYHPAFKAVVAVRKQLAAEGTRTIFNLIGPLLNPVRPDYQLVGVFDASFTHPFAEILGRLGRKRAWAVHGTAPGGAGLDEISLSGESAISDWDGSTVSDSTISPIALGLEEAPLESLRGGDPNQNAAILLAVLDGSERGPKRDIVALNAAAGFAICGLAKDLAGGLVLAREVIDDGRAMAKLDALRSAG